MSFRWKYRSLIVLVVACGTLARVAPAADSSDRNTLPFEGVHAGGLARREVVVPNDSENPLLLKEVSASCSCLRVVGFDHSIAAKTSGTIIVEYRPVQAGAANVELLVQTDRAKDSVITYRWGGQILPTGESSFEGDAKASDVFTSPNETAAQGVGQQLLIVDVRKAEQFNLLHVDGSVNWPRGLLKSLLPSQKRPVVIIGEGADDNALAREVLSLRSLGFDSVRLLRGGVRAWAMAKYPVRGTSLAGAQNALIYPSELFASPDDDWIVMNLVGTNPAQSSNRIPGSVEIQLAGEQGASFAEKISGVIKSRPNASKVLMISRTGEEYESVERNLPPGLALPVFYLSGGMEAYNKFIGMRRAAQASREIRLASGENAGTNQKSSGAVVRGSIAGCATCPKKKDAVR